MRAVPSYLPRARGPASLASFAAASKRAEANFSYPARLRHGTLRAGQFRGARGTGMGERPEAGVSDEAVAAYRRDGALCLRGHSTDWLEPLRQGVAHNLAEPGPIATEHDVASRGRFFSSRRIGTARPLRMSR